MKKIFSGIIALFLMTTIGHCQDAQPSVQLILKSGKQTYFIDERISFLVNVKNLSSKNIQLIGPQGVTQLMLAVLDGKEYKSVGPWGWGGQGALLPNGEIDIAIDLVAYGIAKDMLTVGKHNIAAKLNDTLSNYVTFEVEGNKPN